ncbi:MAG: hypothetical protein DWQ39_00015 [Bacteroidetes bacterium]|nr:MAG: hypothetical protein DWQ39_00015 [Bacteroidota bacterium]REK48472.1 MAG: hypothetical protein DWQ48_09955 [Bacteroidota bacterium]
MNIKFYQNRVYENIQSVCKKISKISAIINGKNCKQVKVCFVLLLISMTGFAQTTVFFDNFNRAALSPGGSPATNYTFVSGGGTNLTAQIVNSDSLRIGNESASSATNGISYVHGELSTYSPAFNPVLSQNGSLITWTFNFRWGRSSGTANPAPIGSGNYGSAIVLCANSSNLLNANGYAVVYGNTDNIDPFRLVAFTGGIHNSGSYDQICNSGVNDLSSFRNHASIRVTYNPSDQTWSLFVRDDGSTAWSNPATGVNSQKGSSTANSVHTNLTMTNFGFVHSHSTATGNNTYFDNYKVTVDCNPPSSLQATNDGPVCEGSDAQLDVTHSGTAPFTYSWTGPNFYASSDRDPILSAVSASDAGTYTVTVSNACGSSTASTNLIVGQPHTVSVGSDQTICEGQSVTVSGTFGGGAVSTSWSSSGDGILGTPVINQNTVTVNYTPGSLDEILQFVNLTFESDNLGACPSVSDEVGININPPAFINNTTTIASGYCPYAIVNLSVQLAGSASSVTWSSNSLQGPSAFANSVGTYPDFNADYSIDPSDANLTGGVVTITAMTNDPDGPGACPAVSTSFVLPVYSAVNAQISANPIMLDCQNQSSQITVALSGTAPFTLTYSIDNIPYTVSNINGPAFVIPGVHNTPAYFNIDYVSDFNNCDAFNTSDFTLTKSPAGPVQNINTGLNYCTIQSAINAVETVNGHTITVDAGNFNEDVLVDKQLSIIGAGIGSSIVSGPIGGAGSTFSLAVSGILLEGFTITRDGNNVNDWSNSGLNTAGVSIQGQSISGVTIKNNRITANRTGIDVNNSNGHNILENEITNNRTGLIFRNQTDNLNVQNNFITGNWTVGVLFLDASGGSNVPVQTASNCVFSNNDISANWYGQVEDRQFGGSLPATGSNLKNFSCNWYGTASPVVSTANATEPGYTSQIPVMFGGTAVAPGGQQDIKGGAYANIVYIPFQIASTDNSTTTGFQPSGTCSAPCALLLTPSSTDAGCPYFDNGTASVSVSGGTGNYSYSWDTSPVQNTGTASGLMAGTYTVTVNDLNGCTSSVSVAVNQPVSNCCPNPPTVDAGSDLSVCRDGTVTISALLGGSATEVTGWSGGAGVYSYPAFPDLSVLDYTPDVLETGTVTLTVTTDVPSGSYCDPGTDQVDILILELPSASLTLLDDEICAGASTELILNFTGAADFIYTWSDGNTTSSQLTTGSSSITIPVSPATSTLYSVESISDNNCVGYPSAQAFLTVHQVPDLELIPAGPVSNHCPSSTVDLSTLNINDNNFTTGVFSYYENQALTIPLSGTVVSNPGTYYIVKTTNTIPPCKDVLEVTVTINSCVCNDPVVVDAGPDISVCIFGDVTLSGLISGAVSTGEWLGGLGTFDPDRNDLNAVYTPHPSEVGTTITLTLLSTVPGGLCTQESDEVNITVDNFYSLDAGPDIRVCQNGEVGLNGIVFDGPVAIEWTGGAGTFDPDRYTLTAIYTPHPSEAGTTVTLTLGPLAGSNVCPPVTDDINIVVDVFHMVDAGTDESICFPGSVQLTAQVSGGASAGTWLGGLGTFNPDRNTLNATYTPDVSETGSMVMLTLESFDAQNVCLSEFDDVFITVVSTIVDAGPDIHVCDNGSVGLGGVITGLVNTGQWTGGLGTFDPDRFDLNAEYYPHPSEYGTVVTLTLQSDPSSVCGVVSNSVNITVDLTPFADAGPDIPTCITGSAQLSAAIGGGAVGGTWLGGLGTFVPDRNNLNIEYFPHASEAGTSVVLTFVSVQAPGSVCLPAMDELIIRVDRVPSANAGPDQTVCYGASASLSAALSGGAVTGVWSTTGDGSFNDNTSHTAVYQPGAGDLMGGSVLLTFTPDPAGVCPVVPDDIIIFINPEITASSLVNDVSCNGGSNGSITLSVSGGSTPYSYAWSNNESSQNISGLSAGSYSVAVTDFYTCTSSHSVHINEPAALVVSVTGTDETCARNDGSASVNVSGGTPGYYYLWSNNEATQSVSGLAGGISYDVTVSDANGCTADQTIFIAEPPVCTSELSLSLFIQGYYDEFTGTMNAALYNSGVPSFGPADCDHVEVCLVAVPGYVTAACFTGVLQTDGTLLATFPHTVIGNSYYLRIRHRNAMETWSGQPLTMTQALSYDFTNAASKAFGSNMVEVSPGVWAIWSGDVSDGVTAGDQDGVISSNDYGQLEDDVQGFLFGYYVSDLTGDGVVSSADYGLIEDNVQLFIFVSQP